MTTDGPYSAAPTAQRRPPASVRVSLVLAFSAAALLAIAAAFLALLVAAFADDGHVESYGLAFAAPNVVVATLLGAGALRLRRGHGDGRWLLTVAAALDLAAAAGWAAVVLRLDDHHDVAQFLKITSPLLIPPVLAAGFAWTAAARRWTPGRSRRGVAAVHR